MNLRYVFIFGLIDSAFMVKGRRRRSRDRGMGGEAGKEQGGGDVRR